jgi:hypothetical protein
LPGLHADQQRRKRSRAAAWQKRCSSNDELLFAVAFDLEPVRRPLADIWGVAALGDQPFEMLIANTRQQFRAVTLQLIRKA